MGQGSALTKTGIGNTPETAQYQDSPQATVAAFGKQSVAPEMMSNTNTPGLQFDDSGNVSSDAGPQPLFTQTKAAVTPKFQQPSFQETQNNPELARKADTKGGKLLSFFLSVANGGAAGAGQPTFGGGFLMAQHADMQRRKAAQEQKQIDIGNQRNASNDAMRASLGASEIAANNARAKKDSEEKDTFTAGGSIFQKQPDGTFKEVATSRQSPEETEAGREKIIQGLKSTSNYSLTPAQEQAYLLTGRLPSQAEHNVSEWQSELDAAGGDPSKALTNSEARRKRISAAGRSDAENSRETNKRLKTDVTNYYGHLTAKGGTEAAIKAVSDRINSGQLTPYQMQVASETLKQLRSEQNSALR